MDALPPREPLRNINACLRVAPLGPLRQLPPRHFWRNSPGRCGRSARVQGSCDNPVYRMSFQ